MHTPHTPRRYTSHAEMKKDRMRHQVTMDTSPLGFSKHDLRGQHPQPSPGKETVPRTPQKGQMMFRVEREGGNGLGLTFERCEDEGMRLRNVVIGGTGYKAGMQECEGMRLYAVNGVVVNTNGELAEACKHSHTLEFVFEEEDAHAGTVPISTPNDPTTPPLHYSQRQLEHDIQHHRTPLVDEPPRGTPHPYSHTSLHYSHRNLTRDVAHHQPLGDSPSRDNNPPPSSHSSQSPRVSYRRLKKDVKHHEELHSRKYEGPGGYEGLFYNQNYAGEQQQTSHRRLSEDKEHHMTALESAGDEMVLMERLQGHWVCSDGTVAEVTDDNVKFGNPVEASERLRCDEKGNEVVLLGAKLLSVADGKARWGDGDVWMQRAATNTVPTHAMEKTAREQPRDPYSCTLYRTASDRILGITWRGSTTILHAVSPNSPASRSGLDYYVGKTVISVNNTPYPSAHLLAHALHAGELRNTLELHFEFDDTDEANVTM
eukprot:TRINITY_DN1850_c1_g1_i1.p1 TRINITY_DN1850_c1_g1~~TRINITY_DN1850_c1_g1_i1.p1  ORF type:complete len:485 (+),score=125.44 TRINITY_DN1850_c1_g1_i1:59-1513(+)